MKRGRRLLTALRVTTQAWDSSICNDTFTSQPGITQPGARQTR